MRSEPMLGTVTKTSPSAWAMVARMSDANRAARRVKAKNSSSSVAVTTPVNWPAASNTARDRCSATPSSSEAEGRER